MRYSPHVVIPGGMASAGSRPPKPNPGPITGLPTTHAWLDEEPRKKSYVCGFMLDTDLRRVLLIEKKRPDWQLGRLNGVGGKIEPGETPREAMAREMWEETGLSTLPEQWATFHAETFADSHVRFMVCPPQPIERLLNATAITDEAPTIKQVDRVAHGAHRTLDNVPYLVLMARAWLQTKPEHRPIGDRADDLRFA